MCGGRYRSDALPRQSLDLSGSKHLTDANFWSLPCLRSVDFSGCKHISVGTVFSLPPAITSISLGECEHLEVDDAFLARVSTRWVLDRETFSPSVVRAQTPPQIGATFSALRHLSLSKTLASEVKPAFRSPGVAFARYSRSLRHGALAAFPAASSSAGRMTKKGTGSRRSVSSHSSCSGSDSGEANWDEDSEARESDDDESGDGVGLRSDAAKRPDQLAPDASPPEPAYVSRWEQRCAERRAYIATRWSNAGISKTPPHTSAAGWAALLRGLPYGLFSLDVRSCTLSFASYTLLYDGVTELRAAKVLSPEAAAAAATRRSSMSAAREAKRLEARAKADHEAADDIVM